MSITLDSAGNNFSTVAVNSGNNVTLRSANALDLGTSNVSGNLNVTTAGAITDSGNIVVAGITTLAAGSGNDITLDSAGSRISLPWASPPAATSPLQMSMLSTLVPPLYRGPST